MRYSQPRRINKDNIKEFERPEPGIYYLLNRVKNAVYVGVSGNIQHRLKAFLYGRADYNQVEHKKTLQKTAKYYKRAYTDISKARKIEKRKKKNLRFNQL